MKNMTKVIEGSLHIVRKGRERRCATAPPPEPLSRPATVAMMLALAHEVRRKIESGEAKSQAAVARELGFTRARLSQVLDLLNLSPDLQEALLTLQAKGTREPLRERALRRVLRWMTWDHQRAENSFGAKRAGRGIT